MMHKAWCSIEKVSYCFSRSSIKFHGHTGGKNWRFESNLRLLGRSQLSNPSDLPCLLVNPILVAKFILRRPQGAAFIIQHKINFKMTLTFKMTFTADSKLKKISWTLKQFSFPPRGPFYWHGLTLVPAWISTWLTLVPAWISNHMPNKVWNEITYPFSNFNSLTVEVCERVYNFIPHFIMDMITYRWWD